MDLEGWRRDVVREFQRTRGLAEKAIAQLSDADYFATPGAETNPVAVIVKHMAGNMRSRWTDFLTTDGEKPDRDRDAEFVLDPADTRAALTACWDASWSILLATLEGLRDADLDRTVTIRAEPHTVYQAIHRQLSHYAYHTGQIVLLARHFAGENWKTLSVAKAASAAFNRSPTSYLERSGGLSS
jgi:uncharacterized damage-inducible protein DinB